MYNGYVMYITIYLILDTLLRCMHVYISTAVPKLVTNYTSCKSKNDIDKSCR